MVRPDGMVKEKIVIVKDMVKTSGGGANGWHNIHWLKLWDAGPTVHNTFVDHDND